MEYNSAMMWPIGRVMDLMAIEQIKMEGAEWKDTRVYDPDTMDSYEIIPDFK